MPCLWSANARSAVSDATVYSFPGTPRAPASQHRRIAAVALLAVLCAAAVHAQPAPLKGIVWEPPGNPAENLADLEAMAGIGVEAVRTGLIDDESILDAADSLGLKLFQELPIAYLSASALLDTLHFAQQLLATQIEHSRPHVSARHFGLAIDSDTSVPNACAYFTSLASMVRQLPGGMAYYRSIFVEDDQCAAAVDFVLLDATDTREPGRILDRWALVHKTPAGLGTLGIPAVSGAFGLRHPASPESQARHLETQLNLLTGSNAVATFVYRWRDRPTPMTPSLHYGLIREDGERRPAYQVVQGIYSGQQRVFAFPLGTSPGAVFPWFVATGWLALGIIALIFQSSTRFRQLLRRYFLAHSFHVESIRIRRELQPSLTAILLLTEALCAGLFLGAVISAVQHHAAFSVLVHKAPEIAQATVAAVLARPWLLISTLALLHLMGALMAALVRVVCNRWIFLLRFRQGIVVSVWARWPVVLLAIAAMPLPALSPHSALKTAVVLGLLGVILAALNMLQITYDTAKLYPRRWELSFFTMGTTYALLAGGMATGLLWSMPDVPENVMFIWNLMTRT